MTLKVVITGGPGTGKTSVINFLSKKYFVFKESAREVLSKNKIFKGKDAEHARGKELQEAIWDLELKHYKKSLSLKKKVVFFDRGFIDGLAYCRTFKIPFSKERLKQAKEIHYDYVFILDPLPKKLYENDTKRSETYKESLRIHKIIYKTYKKYGYRLIRVPFDTVENRANFVLKKLKL